MRNLKQKPKILSKTKDILCKDQKSQILNRKCRRRNILFEKRMISSQSIHRFCTKRELTNFLYVYSLAHISLTQRHFPRVNVSLPSNPHFTYQTLNHRMHVRGWVRNSPHLVIESMGLSTINLGRCESKHASDKRKFKWEKGRIFTCVFWETKRGVGR